MTDKYNEKITVIGAGLMGCGIAQSFLAGGHPVAMFDPNADSRETAPGRILEICDGLVRNGLLEPVKVETLMAGLDIHATLASSAVEAALVIEAVPENLTLKQGLFAEIEANCPASALLATNTSSLPVDEIGANLSDKSRLVVMHWFNPAHLIPVVEVAPSQWTSAQTMDRAVELLDAIGKTPIRLNRAEPGFIVNRMQLALLREAFDILDQGVASGMDIDRAIVGSLGLRWAAMGPLQSVDVINPDVILNVAANLFPQISAAHVAPDMVAQRLRDPAQQLSQDEGASAASSEAAIAERDKMMMAILAQRANSGSGETDV